MTTVKWTKEAVLALRDEVLAGATREEMAARHGVQWQNLYKLMNHHNVYPKALRRVSVVKLRALYQQFVDDPTIRVATLAATIGLTKNALRSRWTRLGLKAVNRKQTFPDRKIQWSTGLTMWTLRSKGKTTEQICKAIGRPYEGDKSARYIRHHLRRWCYDTHTKVPSFKPGTRKLIWLPPPTSPPT